MAQAVVIPKLGQTMEEAAIVKWHKKAGDAVAKGDILFEIETDKAVLEVESFFEGTLLKTLIAEGVTVPVNSVAAYIGTPGEAVPDSAPPPATAEVRSQKTEVRDQKADARPAVAGPAPVAASVASVASRAAPAVPAVPTAPARLFISPRARALAKRKVIDPANVQGTGPDGRITVKDVEAYLQSSGYDQLRITPAARQMAAAEGVDVLRIPRPIGNGRIGVADVQRAVAMKPQKMSKRRQVIARRLTESFTTTPHFYVTVGVDMTDLLAYRKALKDQGKAYTVTDFILEAVILTLREFPTVNSTTDGANVRWHGPVQLGMAVALEEGLVVPVIRNAEELDMDELHEESKNLAAKARGGSLLPDEMSGSTFTVSNMGMLDVDQFHAIINPGEGAILAVASTRDRAVVRDGQIVVRAMMNLTLSVDHRIVDGKMAAEFVNGVRKKLEDVELWKSLT